MKKSLLIITIVIVIAVILFLLLTSRTATETVVTIQVINQSRWANTIEQAVKEWNRTHPGQKVALEQLVIGYPQLRNKLITACGANQPPDISILDGVWLAEFAKKGHLAALDEVDPQWYEAEYKKDFFPVFQNGDIFDNHLWGVRTQTDMAILWYRKDWFNEENLAAPETWDDLTRICMLFQEPAVKNRYGVSTFPLALPLGQKARETLVYQLLPLFWSNGGGILEKNKLILHSKRNIETLTFLRKLVHKHKCVSPEAVAFEWNRAMELFATGKVVMAFGGTYEKKMIQEVSGWNNEEFLRHVGYTLLPSGPQGERSTTAGGMCYVIYNSSPHKKLALEIVKLATSDPIMTEFLLETFQHPPRISIAEGLNEKEHPFLAETAPYLYKARTRPKFPEYSQMSDLLQEMVEKTILEKLEPAIATKQASKKINALMSR